ncbi:MAG: aminotransferase class V-fold PLP-dependent enzyme [Halanaeroarchaeum sp.]
MDIQDVRADIPALQDGRYMNWGASGPSPRVVVDAVETAIETHEYESPTAEGMYPNAFGVLESARETIGDFIGADPADVALTQSTTDALNRVANGLEWTPEDTVLLTDVEHSAGRLPWLRLSHEYGFEVEVLQTDAGRIDRDEFARRADAASVVCFSAIDWLHGRLQPVSALTDLARDAGALSVVDAVQVPGQRAMPVDQWGADVVAAAGHKWLLGPWGAGFVYVDDAVAEGMTPRNVGYRSVEDPNATDYEFKPGARRLEVGTVNPGPYAGVQAAIEVISDLGIDTIEAEIRDLTEYLKDDVEPDRLLSPDGFHSGLITVEIDRPDAVVDRMADAGIHVRSLPTDGTVRASVHAVNRRSDVDAFLDAL